MKPLENALRIILRTIVGKYIKNYLAPRLTYDGWCEANGCEVQKLIFLYEWLDDYNKLSHVGPVEYENFYS